MERAAELFYAPTFGSELRASMKAGVDICTNISGVRSRSNDNERVVDDLIYDMVANIGNVF